MINISGNIFDSTKKADHILEMQGLGEFCSHCFKNQTCESRSTTECPKLIQSSNTTFRLATNMFRGTPFITTFILKVIDRLQRNRD